MRCVVIVRMNFSHGSYEYHQSVIDNARAAVESEFYHFPLERYGGAAELGLLNAYLFRKRLRRDPGWTTPCYRFGHQGTGDPNGIDEGW